jgi:hypothetical protein
MLPFIGRLPVNSQILAITFLCQFYEPEKITFARPVARSNSVRCACPALILHNALEPDARFGESKSVFTRIGQVLMILALLAATGVNVILLQSVAWTTMLANNLRTTSLYQAVEHTFDGKHPCSLCRQIDRSRQAEKKAEFRAEWKKLEFNYAPLVFVFTAPSHSREMRPASDSANSINHTPPAPPPRELPG